MAAFPLTSTFSSPPVPVSFLPAPSVQVLPAASALPVPGGSLRNLSVHKVPSAAAASVLPSPGVKVPWNSTGSPRFGQATVGSAEDPRSHVIGSERLREYSLNQPSQVVSQQRLMEPPPNLLDLRRAQATGCPYGTANLQPEPSPEVSLPAFDHMDRDGDGFITRDEFMKAVVGEQAVSSTGNTLRWVQEPFFQYGDRRCWWSQQVPVPEQNHGVTINAEYLTPPNQGREVFVHDDDGLYSRDWRHIGPFMKREPKPGLEQYLEEIHADLHGAEDLLGERMKHGGHGMGYADPKASKPRLRLLPKNFMKQKKDREGPTWRRIHDEVGAEILNPRQIENFFGNMDAVRYQPLSYKLLS